MLTRAAAARSRSALAAFSGLYYAIAVLNDSAYREEFVSNLIDEMRDTFRLRPSTSSAAAWWPASTCARSCRRWRSGAERSGHRHRAAAARVAAARQRAGARVALDRLDAAEEQVERAEARQRRGPRARASSVGMPGST